MASIAELFIELGVKTDTKALKGVNETVKSLRNNLGLVAAAFTGAVVGLDRFVNSALNGVVALQNLENQTGLSIEKLQKFQQAGQLSNLAISADQIAQSIGNVQRNLANIRIGQGDIAPFQLLGIDIRGADAFGVIEQIRESIKGLDPALATNLITGIGLSPDFINLLKLSREEFDALGENVFLSGKQRADIDKVGTSIKALQLRFKALKDQAVAKLAPELDKLVRQFFKWIKDNGDKIIRTITSIAKGFAAFAKAVGNAFSLVSRFLEKILGMENGVKALAVAFAFLTLSMFPFLAALTSIILIMDDFLVFTRGGESLIGDFVNALKNIPKAFGEIPNFAKFLGGAALLGIITKLTGAMLGFKEATSGVLKLLTRFGAIGAGVFAAFNLGKKGGEKLGEKLENTEAGKFVGEGLLSISDFFSNVFGKTKNLLGFGDEQSALPNNLTNNNVTINNNIGISGVQDPASVRSEIERSVIPITQESLNRVQATQGNGIR